MHKCQIIFVIFLKETKSGFNLCTSMTPHCFSCITEPLRCMQPHLATLQEVLPSGAVSSFQATPTTRSRVQTASSRRPAAARLFFARYFLLGLLTNSTYFSCNSNSSNWPNGNCTECVKLVTEAVKQFERRLVIESVSPRLTFA